VRVYNSAMLDSISMGFLSDVGKISMDILCVFGLLALLTTLGMVRGKNVVLQLLLSMYPAALVAVFFPFYNNLKVGLIATSSVFPPLLIFLVSVAIFFFSFRTFIDSKHRLRSFWRFVEMVVLSSMVVGLFFSVLYHVVGFENYYNFSHVLDTLFVSPEAMFVWIVAPVACVPLFVRL